VSELDFDDADDEALNARLGTVLGGRYRLVARLGRGGMGAVYRAEHVELGRDVAVKVLAPELARNRNAIERFLREARTASRIQHPNIVHVYDLGRAEDGAPYLAMELLQGRDLEEELEAHDGTLPPKRVVELLTPIADALDVCHAKGVVHRDLKPSNIFLAQLEGGREIPTLVDFGLAMLLAADERLTRTGVVVGTPHYLPPESARGDLPGPAGDVYALATVAYRALCGVTPFDAALASGILVQKIAGPAPSMGERTRGHYPERVEAVLARGLAIEPSERPPTAMALMQELAAAVEGSADEPWSRGSGAAPIEVETSIATRRARELAPTAASPTADRSPNADASSAERATRADTPSAARADAPREVSEVAASPPREPERRSRAPLVLGVVLAAVVLGVAGALGTALLETSPPIEPPQPIEPRADRIEEMPPERDAPIAIGPSTRTEPIDAPSALASDEPSRRDETAIEASREREDEPRAAREVAPRARIEPTRSTPSEPAADTPITQERPEHRTAPAPAPSTEAAPHGASDASEGHAEAERLVRSAGSLLLRGDHAGATTLLERATRLSPRYAPAWRSLGLAHERAQRSDDARRAYQRYLELAPNASDRARIEQRIASL
jgi:serine/threonine-protein kinase